MLDGRNCNSDMQIRQGHWYPQAAPHESGTALGKPEVRGWPHPLRPSSHRLRSDHDFAGAGLRPVPMWRGFSWAKRFLLTSGTLVVCGVEKKRASG
jgi:hypothetical protein